MTGIVREAPLPNIESIAAAVAEASVKIQESKGFNLKSLNEARKVLEQANFNVSEQTADKLLETQLSLSSGDNGMNQGSIGQNTFEIASSLVKDFQPEIRLEESPFNYILPTKVSTATKYQQDIMQSGSGWAHEAGAVNGINNIVPMLEADGFTWNGYEWTETGEIKGNDLISLRNPGSSAIDKANVTQRIMYSQLNMMNRQFTNFELVRIDTIQRGVYSYKGVNISAGLDSSNLASFSASLGTYSIATNQLTLNSALAAEDFILELMSYTTRLISLGAFPKEFIMDFVLYQTIIQSPAVQNKIKYISMNSSNDPAKIQRNLFRVDTIPELMGIPITIYKGSVKFSGGPTTAANTRPITWGKDIQIGTNSPNFRVSIVLENTGLSRVGDSMFFPNVYKDHAVGLNGGNVRMENQSGFVLLQQDLAQYNFLNQKIQWATSATFNPIVYLPNMIHNFSANVTVTA